MQNQQREEVHGLIYTLGSIFGANVFDQNLKKCLERHETSRNAKKGNVRESFWDDKNWRGVAKCKKSKKSQNESCSKCELPRNHVCLGWDKLTWQTDILENP